jgi:ubiquinone/menaquinone biosynthesis C-methylase UbiE
MSFDALAPYYRWMEMMLAGGALHRCRTAFLDEIPRPERILLLGEGHGRSLAEFCRRFPAAQITCVDASEPMLTQARRHLARQHLPAHQVEFIRADVLDWTPPPGGYDLVATHFFLDCFRPGQLERMTPKIAASLQPRGIWLIADFQAPTGGWRGLRSRLILGLLYVFFRRVTRLPARTLTPPDSLVAQTGLALQRRITIEWGLLHSDWWQKPVA